MLRQVPTPKNLMIDLHGKSVQEAKKLIQGHFEKIVSDNITEIYIITGRGKHVNPDGSRGVLKKLLPKFLLRYDPHIMQINKEIGAYKIILRTRLQLEHEMNTALESLQLNKEGELWFINYLEEQVIKNDLAALGLLGNIYLTGGFKAFYNPKKGLALLEQADHLGSMEAAHQLGCIYLEGLLIPQNHRKAFLYLEKVAKSDHTLGQLYLAKCYLLGQGAKQSDEQATFWLEKAAAPGCAQAQATLGKSYLDGEFTPQNIKLGLHYLTQAAEQHMDESVVILARLYATGNHIAQSNSKAFDLYLRAAFSNNNYTLYMVGQYLVDGRCGFPASDSTAFEWFLKAAERDDADGQAKVGFSYLQGKGTEKNLKKALYWTNKGIAQKNKLAYYVMAEIHRTEAKYDEIKAFQYKQLSAEAGFAAAQFELSLDLMAGNNIAVRNIKQGLYWLKLAKEQNFAEAVTLYQDLQNQRNNDEKTPLALLSTTLNVKETTSSLTNSAFYQKQAKILYK